MFGGPPNTLPLVIYIGPRDILLLGYYYITTCHSKQLLVGLMVLSEDRENFQQIYQNYLVALNVYWQ